jgi:hypothetical protein
MTLHNDPTRFVQIVENALELSYRKNESVLWTRIHDFYTLRYLNPDSPEKRNFKLFGWDAHREAKEASMTTPTPTTQSTQWLAKYTNPTRDLSGYAYHNFINDEQLIFTTTNNTIRVTLTNNITDHVRQDFPNWTDAINFAKGILATTHQPY